VVAVTPDPGPFVGCLANKTNRGSSAVKGQIYNVAKSAVLAPCVKDDQQITFGNAAGPEGPEGQQGPEGPQGPQGDPAALVPASKFYATQEVHASQTFTFGETINVTSILVGDSAAGLKEVAGGHQSIVLWGFIPGQAEPVFLWEGPRTGQLSFTNALPLDAVMAGCVLPDCSFWLTVVGN
jgi:hypothetical protein